MKMLVFNNNLLIILTIKNDDDKYLNIVKLNDNFNENKIGSISDYYFEKTKIDKDAGIINNVIH